MSLQTNKYCQAHHCRFPWSHLTSSHLCGSCHKFGHGEGECGDQSKIDHLKNISSCDRLPDHLYCQMGGCAYSWSHQSSAHHCRLCLKNHSLYDCPLVAGYHQSQEAGGGGSIGSDEVTARPLNIQCPLCREINIIAADQKKVYGVRDQCVVCMESSCEIYFPKCGHVCLCHSCGNQLNTANNVNNQPPSIEVLSPLITSIALEKMGGAQGPIYIVLSAGMGCLWYIRRSSVNAPLEGFFMHSDSWGQYGSDETPQLNQFILGYTDLFPN